MKWEGFSRVLALSLSLVLVPGVARAADFRPFGPVTSRIENNFCGWSSADFNGDGILDIAGIGGYRNDLVVLQGRADGTFVELSRTTIEGAYDETACGDLDGDGAPDLVLFSIPPDVRFSVWLSAGNGRFALHGSPVPLSFTTVAERVVDLDGDGALDLLCNGEYGSDRMWWRGKGDGTFHDGMPVLPSPNTHLMGVAELDGRPGMEAVFLASSRLSVWRVFDGQEPTELYARDLGVSFAATLFHDVDGDGRTDVFVDNRESLRQHEKIAIRSLGDGSFDAPVTLTNESGIPHRIETLRPFDFDGLANPEFLAWLSMELRMGRLVVDWEGKSFRITESWLAEHPWVDWEDDKVPVLTDVDADGMLDVVWPAMGDIAVVRGVPGGFAGPRYLFPEERVAWAGMAPSSDQVILVRLTEWQGVELAVCRRRPEGGVTDPSGFSVLPFRPAFGGYPEQTKLVAHDVNRDGLLDLVNVEGTSFRVAAQQETGGFAVLTDARLEAVGLGAILPEGNVAVCDIDGDREDEILFLTGTLASPSIAGVKVAPGGTIAKAFEQALASSGVSLAAGDLDGNGYDDVLYGDMVYQVEILFIEAGGVRERKTVSTGAPGGRPTLINVMRTGDLNGDGLLDIVCGHVGDGITILYNEGAGTFSSPANYWFGWCTYWIDVADVDADGPADLVAFMERYPTMGPNFERRLVTLQGGESAPFARSSSFLVSTFPPYFPTCVRDIDADGLPDIVMRDLLVYWNEGAYPPTAAFAVDAVAGYTPCTATFTHTGSLGGDADARLAWEFGDGAVAEGRVVSHTYENEGTEPRTFVARLTVTSALGSSSSSREITVYPPLSFDFSAAPAGPDPRCVRFAGSGTVGMIAQFAWSFGDEADSTLPDPSHCYVHSGRYAVRCVVQGPVPGDPRNAVTASREVEAGRAFLRGDANGDGEHELADAIVMLEYVFGAEDPGGCPDAYDANDSGECDIADPIYLLSFLFGETAPCPAPYPAPGVDPTPDAIECP